MVTKKELESISIFSNNYSFKPTSHFSAILQEDILIDRKSLFLHDVVELLCDKAYCNGIKEGKAQRSSEFKQLINNELES